jgi:serine/threonine protein kinase
MSSAGAQLVGTVLASRYRLDRLLGEGAMGVVYAGVDVEGRPCAIKLLLDPRASRASQEMLARFVREGRIPAELASPHVARVLDLAVDPALQVPFIVMELLRGEDLQNLSGRLGPLEPELAVRLILQAARGLSEAHARGIVHRDIKPANLFLHDPGDGALVVKVADFGIAKSLFGNDELTHTGRAMGTPYYMSPEQAKNAKRVDARADVWSLAMTLYTLLVGRPAFATAASFTEIVIALTSGAVEPIQKMAPWVAPELARIVHGALLADLGIRCPGIDAFAAALAPFAGATEAVRAADLRGLDASRRVPTAVAAVPSSWAEVTQPAARGVESLVGQVVGGRYRLERLLGSGGMGTVYEVVDASGARFALKLILGETAHDKPELFKRFVREARSSMAVRDEHVVRVFEADSDPSRGWPYIVMELLSGSDLDHVIKERGALQAGAVARLFVEAARGLSAAHAQGIVHRDIKPANVFLHRQGGRVVAKICDFGIAKQLGDAQQEGGELTSTGGFMGSPMYMSPEQARSAKHVDLRTDVWSLGVALYEALAGRKPWEGCTAVGEIIVAICTQPIPPLGDVAPWIDARLAAVVHRALERDPSRRWPTMSSFAEALAPFADGELAAPPAPVPDALRSTVLPRASLGATTSAPSQQPVESKPARSRGGALAISALVVVTGAIGTAYWVQRGEHAPPKVPAPAGTNSQPSNRHASVAIEPATASVRVNGAPASLDDGAVGLDGAPGDRFEIEVRAGDRVEVREVVLDKEGRPSIGRIALTAASVATASSSAPKGDAPSSATRAPAVAIRPAIGKASTSSPPPATEPSKPPPNPGDHPVVEATTKTTTDPGPATASTF